MNNQNENYNYTNTNPRIHKYSTINKFILVVAYLCTTILVLGLLGISIRNILKYNFSKKLKTWLTNKYINIRNPENQNNNSNRKYVENIIIKTLGEIVIPGEKTNKNECAICFEEFKQQEKLFKLNCNHIFHLECWEQWDKHSINTNCPLCRYTI